MVMTVESSLLSHFSPSSVLSSTTTTRTQRNASSSAPFSSASGISVSYLGSGSGSAIAGTISLQSAGLVKLGKAGCGFTRLGHDGDVNPSRLAISPWLQGTVRARPLNAAIAATAEEGLKWWERGGAPNMHDISSTRDFVDELSSAGDKLVIVEFFATWCGSCRALYPKLCKLAAQNDQIRILKVNLDENKKMCKALGVKVLPFFHFYRAVGRVDSFSCSLSKLEKLKDAIAKHLDGAIGDGACQDSIEDIFASLQPLLDSADKPAAAAGSSG